MYQNSKIYLGLADGQRVEMPLNICNRHGLIAGASGTGKTITMNVLAESFSDAGVPVFLCDVKGDVSGLCCPGEKNEGMEKRIDKFGIRDCFEYKGYPVCFWDVYGKQGHPIRVTISDMGPELLSRLMDLTPAQEGILNIVFKIADDNGLMLTDLKDLKALLEHVNEHRADYLMKYGNIVSATVGGVLRALLPLEMQGADEFFGEPALDIHDWMRTAVDGRGYINLLDCVELVQNPKLYATLMLWLMTELFEELPEVGDPDKPRLVFFFDEAHLLFNDAPKVLVQKIEQVVKLVRSKGVGVYFVTQNPSDIPDGVLAQLSNRIQHALRAYTPAEQKAIRAAAQSFRVNPAFKTEEVITTLGVGHALISVLDEEGVPGIVQQTSVICPQSLMAKADPVTRAAVASNDGMSKYDIAIDNESAYEVLEEQKAEDAEKAQLAAEREAFEKEKAAYEEQKRKEEEAAQKKKEKEEEAARKKLEKEEEAARKKKEKEEEAAEKKKEREKEKKEEARRRKSEKRREKIETQLISAGGQILKRGLLGILKK